VIPDNAQIAEQRMPEVGDIICCPEHNFVQVVDRVETGGRDCVATVWGAIRQPNWRDSDSKTYYRPPPHKDGDYIIKPGAEWDSIWADYCAWRLLEGSN
jgi:hypothetical protein